MEQRVTIVALGVKDLRDAFLGGHSGIFADPEGHLWEVAWNPLAPLGKRGAFQWKGCSLVSAVEVERPEEASRGPRSRDGADASAPGQ